MWYQSESVITVVSAKLCMSIVRCPSFWRAVRTVVDVIERCMRVVRVVDDEGTTKTITVLRRQVAVVPEGASLIRNREVVQE